MHELFNMDELEAFLEEAGDKVVVIDFWAGWCGPCKLVGPVFERLSKDPSVSAKLLFVKVDVDEATDIAEWIGIECMPMFVFYKGGEKACTVKLYNETTFGSRKGGRNEIDEFAGANGKMLEEKIRQHAQD